ncbi:MAG: recombinase family protein [Bacillaceae bacterium]|nr:recombinase family protein [Bacillaceae bacterium]
MKQKAKQGEWNGGAPPLGYNLVDKELVINEEEKQIVEFIFEEYMKNQGYLAIVDKLKEKGYKTKTYVAKNGKVKQGTDFSINAVKEILKNPVVCWNCTLGVQRRLGKERR